MTQSNVIIVGCGGIGFHLHNLARIAPPDTSLWFVDNDTYEPRNGARQGPSSNPAAESKATVTAKQATALNPKIEILPLTTKIQNVNLPQNVPTTILCCVDNTAARKHCYEALLAPDNGVDTLIVGANETLTGEAYLFIPGITPDPMDRYPDTFLSKTEQGQGLSCHEKVTRGDIQLASTNMIVACDMIMLYRHTLTLPPLIGDIDILYEIRTSEHRKEYLCTQSQAQPTRSQGLQ